MEPRGVGGNLQIEVDKAMSFSSQSLSLELCAFEVQNSSERLDDLLDRKHDHGGVIAEVTATVAGNSIH
jgi:hypothetical protein